MRDDSAKWTPAAGLNRAPFQSGGVTMRLHRPARQTLISGPCAAALRFSGMQTAIGWPDPATGDSYALRLRRDRILVIDGPELTDGWHESDGVAVSDMTGAYGVIDLDGPDAFALLCRGTEITRDAPSASVARGFSGYPVLLYRRADDVYRLHMPRGYLDAVWALLAGFADALRPES